MGRCLKCAQGYYMEGWKCSMEKEVDFQLEMAADISTFKQQVVEFKEEVSRMAFGWENINRVRITSITEGSTIVRGAVEAEDFS